MAVVIEVGQCEQVRKAIDIRLDSVTLPNTTILLPIYAGYAVEKTILRLPDSYDPELEPKVLSAAIFNCAALLVLAIKQMQIERIAGNEQRYVGTDAMKKIEELESRANAIIDSVLATIGGASQYASVRPNFFTLGKARRADRW